MAFSAPAALQDLPPELKLRTITNGFMHTAAVYSAAKLRIADALVDGPLSAADLAARVEARPDHLRRLMRLLILLGVFKEEAPGTYANNEVSALLAQGEHGGKPVPSGRDMTMHMGHESYGAWGHLSEALLLSHPSGLPMHDFTGGPDFWGWLSQNKEPEERFDRAMTAFSAEAIPGILGDFDWAPFADKTVGDIGGGEGSVLAALMEAHPTMRGLLFDRPAVIDNARALWEGDHAALAPRATLAGGSFFESVPPADAYFMKFILHDWSDEDSTKILKVLRASAPPGARVLLCEHALPDDMASTERWQAELDMQMLACAGGRERTVGEWRALLAGAGWELKSVTRLRTGMSILEGA